MSTHHGETARRGRVLVLLATFGLVYALLAITSLRTKSVTIDEFGHLPAGLNTLRSGDFRYCQLNPPLANALNAIAIAGTDARIVAPEDYPERSRYGFWPNGYLFMEQNRAAYRELVFSARLVSVALGLGLGLVAFAFARRVAPARGDVAGLLAAGLTWFSPEVLAHARLVTTDIALTLSFVSSTFTLCLFARRPTGGRALACGIVLGLAQLTKFTAVYLVASHLAVFSWLLLDPRFRERRRAYALGVPVVFGLALLTLNAGYGFQGTLARLGDHAFDSEPLRELSASLPASLPVPLPRAYVDAFDQQLFDVDKGDPSYLFGESYRGGRWYYFLALASIKVPLPVLLLGLLALVHALRGRGPALFDTLQVLLPGAVVFAMFSLFSNKQIGLRLVLPSLALVWIWVGATLASVTWSRRVAGLGALLFGWLALEVARVHPHYLAYFNQLVGGPEHGYEAAIGSNLDWGQDLPALERFMDENGIDTIQLLYYGRVDPALYGIDYIVPKGREWRGWVAISRSLRGRRYQVNDHGRPFDVRPLDDAALTGLEHVATLGHTIDVFRAAAR